MGDRKVQNKYIPPDFDPSKIPRGTKLSSKDGTVPVRMMIPFSMQCETCHNFLYRGTKYNAKKEPMGGPDGKYLGTITRFRFYIKCNFCSRSVTFLTDPENCDYAMESGATRNFEVKNKIKKQKIESDLAAATEENHTPIDPLAALQDRVDASQREMAEHDQLEQIRALNAQHVQLLMASKNKEGKDETDDQGGSAADTDILTAEDEELIRSIQFRKKNTNSKPAPLSTGADRDDVRRLTSVDEEKYEEHRRKEQLRLEQRQRELFERATSHPVSSVAALPVIIKTKRKRVSSDNDGRSNGARIDQEAVKPVPAPEKTFVNPIGPNAVTATAPLARNTGLANLLGGYSSDSDAD
jgi:Saf4/Yju2 protein